MSVCAWLHGRSANEPRAPFEFYWLITIRFDSGDLLRVDCATLLTCYNDRQTRIHILCARANESIRELCFAQRAHLNSPQKSRVRWRRRRRAVGHCARRTCCTAHTHLLGANTHTLWPLNYVPEWPAQVRERRAAVQRARRRASTEVRRSRRPLIASRVSLTRRKKRARVVIWILQ